MALSLKNKETDRPAREIAALPNDWHAEVRSRVATQDASASSTPRQPAHRPPG